MSKIPRKLRLNLFGKIYLLIAISSTVLIWGISLLSDLAESHVSTISSEHQSTLMEYSQQAKKLIIKGDNVALRQWRESIENREETWLAIARVEAIGLKGGYDETQFSERMDLSVGRDIRYPIHLYFNYNPIMQLPIEGTEYQLLIQLPQRMRPGKYWRIVDLLITLALPVLLVALLSYVIYYHIIAPLKHLQSVTQQISAGDYEARIGYPWNKRHDEITELANSFDRMAEHISGQLIQQRQLIQDISHELRTPITRIKLVLSDRDQKQVLDRIEQEVESMQSLVEDCLTLSWLETERPTLDQEQVEICSLIEAIADDARFEFPEQNLVLSLPEHCILENSSHRALGQALENVIRNALKYSPPERTVTVCVKNLQDHCEISVLDQGPGVEERQLKKMFEPFIRLESSRGRDSGGYGLGLALSQRQVLAIGGEIYAQNRPEGGLAIFISVPLERILAT